MDGSTVRGNLKEQIFGIGTSCIHGRFVQGEIWCKIQMTEGLGESLPPLSNLQYLSEF